MTSNNRQYDRLGRFKPHKGRIESIPTWKLEEIRDNDFRGITGEDYGADYKEQIVQELFKRYEKQRLKAEKAFRRQQREERKQETLRIKQLKATCPF